MKLNDILENEEETKSIRNSGYYGLHNTFEKLKNSRKKGNRLEKYTNYMIKQIEDYTPRELIYFIGEKIGKTSSDKERKLLSIYNKVAWNNIAEKYGMDEFFESEKAGYLSKIKDYLLDKYDKVSSSLYSTIDKYASKFKEKKNYSERNNESKMNYTQNY